MSYARIPFPDGDVLIDTDDLQRLGARTIYIGSNGYPYFSTELTGPVLLHLFVVGGRIPGRHIDHLDGNVRDCRKRNLRVATYQQNQVNRHRLNRNNASGHRGVGWVAKKRRWRAQITVAHRNLHLGLFVSLEDALEARRTAELEHYGEECPR